MAEAYTTAEQQRLGQRKAQLLPWIADPLKHFFNHGKHGHPQVHGASGHHAVPQGDEKEPILASSSASVMTTESTKRNRDIQEKIEAEEASSGELFYDLFFVANLTTVTAVHYVTDYQSLGSYVLFFIILWFTWLQTTLYDIRFSVDSVYERTVKLVHFAVMIGFAATTLAWNPLEPSPKTHMMNLKSMSVTLMASRWALGVQYGVAAYYSKRYRKGTTPLIIHSAVMLLCGFGYLALWFSFNTYSRMSWVAWYPIIFIELVTVCGASTVWKDIGFKRTHLVERMRLLTLIVMGEGIIVMLKAVNAVEKGATSGVGWSVSTFCIVGASIGLVYFLFMFYFDYTPQHVHYGSIRQQIWTCLHFPFHLSVVLSVEGLRQLTTYWAFIESRRAVKFAWDSAYRSATDPNVGNRQRMQLMRGFAEYLYTDGTAIELVKNYSFINGIITNLTNADANAWGQQQRNETLWLNYYISRAHAQFYGMKIPYPKTNGTTLEAVLGDRMVAEFPVQRLYALVFQYFYGALAVVFFMYGIMGLFVRRSKDMWDYFSVGLRFTVGIMFICIERIKINQGLYDQFINSLWPIPTACLMILAVLFIDKTVGLYAYRRMKASMHRVNREIGLEPERTALKHAQYSPPHGHAHAQTQPHAQPHAHPSPLLQQSTEYSPHVSPSPPPLHHRAGSP